MILHVNCNKLLTDMADFVQQQGIMILHVNCNKLLTDMANFVQQHGVALLQGRGPFKRLLHLRRKGLPSVRGVREFVLQLQGEADIRQGRGGNNTPNNCPRKQYLKDSQLLYSLAFLRALS